MFRKVIIPLDTSQMAETVLPYVRNLTTPHKSRLVLVHSIESQTFAYAALSDEPQLHKMWISSSKQSGSDYLVQMQNRLQDEGYVVTIRISQGDAAQFISDVASEENADLIAMTTHGRTGILRWALGSVADRVVRTLHQPVLLVRSTIEPSEIVHLQRILVPLDGSALAERALTQAKLIAKDSDASICLVRVLQPLDKWEKQLLYGVDQPMDNIAIRRADEARIYLTRARQQLEASQIRATAQMVTGRVGESILDVAEKEAVDLIVMSTHGHGGYTRWVYGSIANQVLHGASLPLLLVRGTLEEEVPEFGQLQPAFAA